VRLGLTVLILASALGALFVSAARTPSSRTTTQLVLTWRKLSCENPPATLLAECTEVRKAEKTFDKQVRAKGWLNNPVVLPSGTYLVLKPGGGVTPASASP